MRWSTPLGMRVKRRPIYEVISIGHAPHAPQQRSATDPQWIKLRIEYCSKKKKVSFLPKNKEIDLCLLTGNDRERHPRHQLVDAVQNLLPAGMCAKTWYISGSRWMKVARVMVPKHNASAGAMPLKDLFQHPQNLGKGKFGTVYMAGDGNVDKAGDGNVDTAGDGTVDTAGDGADEEVYYIAIKSTDWLSAAYVLSEKPWHDEIACGMILQKAPNCMGLQGWRVESKRMGNHAMLRLHVTMTPMDYSLTEVVEKCPVTITGVAFLSLLLGAAMGVSQMHSLNMVHCDIKGDNFFVAVEACDKEVPIPKEAIGGHNVTVCIGDYGLTLHGIEGNKSAPFNHGGDSEYCRDANHLPSKSRDLYNFGRMIEILMLLGLSNGTLNLSSTLFNRLIAVAEKLQSSVPATCPTAAELVDIFAGLVKLGEQYNAPVLVEGEPEVEKESKGKEESVSVEEDKWARQLKKQLEEVSSSPPLSTARLVSLSDPGESCVNTKRSQLASCGLKEEASSPALSTAALSDCTRGLKDEASSPALSSAALSDLGSRSEVNRASDNCAEEIYPYVDLYPSFVPVNTNEWSRTRCAASTRAAYSRRLCEDRLFEAPVSVDCFPVEGTFFNTASYLKIMDKEVGSGDCFPGAAAVKAAGPTWGAMGRRVVGFARSLLPTW